MATWFISVIAQFLEKGTQQKIERWIEWKWRQFNPFYFLDSFKNEKSIPGDQTNFFRFNIKADFWKNIVLFDFHAKVIFLFLLKTNEKTFDF